MAATVPLNTGSLRSTGWSVHTRLPSSQQAPPPRGCSACTPSELKAESSSKHIGGTRSERCCASRVTTILHCLASAKGATSTSIGSGSPFSTTLDRRSPPPTPPALSSPYPPPPPSPPRVAP